MNDELHNLMVDNCVSKNAFPIPKGQITDLPLWFRKKIYGCIKQIDFDEIDEMLKNPDVSTVSCTEFEGLNIIVGKDEIFIL